MTNIDGASLMVQADLEGAGQWINNASQGIADELNKLIGLLEPLQATWTGPAAGYYGGLQEEWNYAAEGLFGPYGVLGEIARAMNVNWNNYSEAEWSNVKTWRTGS
ncbi:WXG100 family type VII secretion target [Streptomyces sp. NBC_01476]|uniref:WXG100 family type VII secretion target n=1 Tax=Streptomyces sp. NBC_01476 TaxID=2903881 RepID=UPI002E2FF179|nr:WXG100 family type VII secretion target [Streptomyces sp. NBC_01476]